MTASAQPRAANAPAQRWAVVGGGILGMMLAHRLAQAGHKVTLFEAAPHLGGLASAWRLEDIVWDRHYHVILQSDTRLLSLLAELGLDQQMEWVQTRTGFLVDRKLYSMSNTLEFLRFPPLRLLDKLRLGFTIFYASRIKDWKRLEKILVVDWLRRWSGRRTFEKIWLPLLKAKLGDNYSKTSAAFIWATISRMYSARRSGAKKEMFGYVRGGYAQILDRFREQLLAEGVRIELGHAATRVEPASAGVEVTFRNGHRETFDQAVLSVAAPIAAELCPALSPEEQARLRGVDYMGVVCASMLLRRPLGGFYVTNVTDPGVPFTGVIEMSALVDKKEFGGKTLVYLPKYVTQEDTLITRSDAEIQELFVGAMERLYPGFDRGDLLSFRISREKFVMAVSTLGYSDRVPGIGTSVPGVHIVNSSQIVNGTLNVNETLQLAERAAARFLARAPATAENGGPRLDPAHRQPVS